jgi:hypothetical protein
MNELIPLSAEFAFFTNPGKGFCAATGLFEL